MDSASDITTANAIKDGAVITKIAYGFLIFSFLGYAGQYQASQSMRRDLDEQVSKRIDIFTVDTKHYQFDEGSYEIRPDTLQGRGIAITGEDSTVFVGTIPVNAKKVELRTFNYKVAAGIIALGLAAVAIIVVSNAKAPGPAWVT
jgi:hypothetical protein